MLHPPLIGRKARVLAPLRVRQSVSTALPNRLAGGPDHQVTVLCPHALVGRVLAMPRPLTGRLLAIGQPAGAGPGAEADRGLEQRAFDEAPDTGSLALVERG